MPGIPLADPITGILNWQYREPPALSPIFLGNSSANNGGGGTTLNIPHPGGVVQNAFVVLTVAVEGGAGGMTFNESFNEIATVFEGMRLRAFWKLYDVADESPYRVTVDTGVRMLGGTLAYLQVDPDDPIGFVYTESKNGKSMEVDSQIAVARSRLILATAVASDDGIEALGNTQDMTPQYEPRSTRNHKVWDQDWPDGGSTGTREWEIGTSVSQDLTAIFFSLNPTT